MMEIMSERIRKGVNNVEIKDSYISVIHEGEVSYGGNQQWFAGKVMRGYGCGAIGAADVLMYLMRRQPSKIRIPFTFPCEKAIYQNCVNFWRKKYFPILPRLGMSGWLLVMGLSRSFRKYRLPYRVRWGVPLARMQAAIEEMLKADIPVILSVGPNFPILWGKQGVPLYRKNGEGTYIKRQDIRAHYMVVTGIVDGKLRVSSWGKEYWIDWEEYLEYIKRYSWGLVSNICHIEKNNK